MNRLRIAPIVEGHGEVAAVPELLRRIGTELLADTAVEVLKPIRRARTKILPGSAKEGAARLNTAELERAVGLAASKLAAASPAPDASLVLVIVDADRDCAAQIAPPLLTAASRATRLPVACVLAVVEYESWLIAGGSTLLEQLGIVNEELPTDPETRRTGKGWIEGCFRRHKRAYSPTLDMPRLTARMDLSDARRHSPSFDKLCRDLAKAAGCELA